MSRGQWVRLGALAAVLVGFFVVAELTGLRHKVTVHAIREHVVAAGPWGVVLFVVAFLIGELLHLPGILFYITGVAIWGRLWGGLLGGTTAVVSVAFTFLLVRAIGGQPLAVASRPAVQRLMVRLRENPITTVAVLRCVFFITPSITYALALSPIRFGQMILGSTIGLVPPLTLAAILSERVMRWMHAG